MPDTCPHCGKPVSDDEALLCLFCGQSLQKPFGLMGNFKYGPWHYLVALLILIVIAAFILLQVF